MGYTVKEGRRFQTALLNDLDLNITGSSPSPATGGRITAAHGGNSLRHAEVVRTHEDVEVVYPVHLSPVVRECARRYLGGKDRIHLIRPPWTWRRCTTFGPGAIWS